jgi:hypothetical protein
VSRKKRKCGIPHTVMVSWIYQSYIHSTAVDYAEGLNLPDLVWAGVSILPNVEHIARQATGGGEMTVGLHSITMPSSF